MLLSHASLRQTSFGMLRLTKTIILQSDHLLGVHSESTLFCPAFLRMARDQLLQVLAIADWNVYLGLNSPSVF